MKSKTYTPEVSRQHMIVFSREELIDALTSYAKSKGHCLPDGPKEDLRANFSDDGIATLTRWVKCTVKEDSND